MKKIIILLLVCMLSVSCSSQPQEAYSETGPYVTETAPLITEAETAHKFDSFGKLPVDFSYNLPSYFLGSYEEYRSLIRTTDMPDNFITYEMISQLGAFQSLYFPTNELVHYSYYLIDENGIELKIEIKSMDYANEYPDKEYLTQTPPNLREFDFLPDLVRYYVLCEDVEYVYSQGRFLNWILMYLTKQQVRLEIFVVSGRLAEYPTEGANTFIAKLLSNETALEAIESLKASIHSAQQK